MSYGPPTEFAPDGSRRVTVVNSGPGGSNAPSLVPGFSYLYNMSPGTAIFLGDIAPEGARKALIQPQGGAVRFSFDGGVSYSSGLLVADGQVLTLETAAEVSAAHLFLDASSVNSSVRLFVIYYAEGA